MATSKKTASNTPRTPAGSGIGQPLEQSWVGKATEAATSMTTIMVDVDKLVMKEQYREKPTEEKALKAWEESLRTLAASIKADGLLQPIIVRREGDDWVVVAGHRRVTACRMIGLKRIPAMHSQVGAIKSMVQQFKENNERVDHSLRDKAAFAKKMYDTVPEPKFETVMKELGMNKTQLSQLLTLVPGEKQAGKITLKAVQDGKCPGGLGGGYALSKLEELDPAEAQAVVDNWENETRATIQARYDAAKKAAGKGKKEKPDETGKGGSPGKGQKPPTEQEKKDAAYDAAIDTLSTGEPQDIIRGMMETATLKRGWKGKLEAIIEALEILKADAVAAAATVSQKPSEE